jgi:DNA-directed RNA polymerase subunit omega
MAKRIPLEPIVEKVGNYYETVHVAAKRARHLYTVDSYTFGKDERGEEHKKTVIALMEILEGKVCPKREK